MSGDFNWNDHPIVSADSAPSAPAARPVTPGAGKAFSWDDHPVVQVAAPAAPEGSFLENAGNGVLKMVGAVGRQVDRFSGAPVRSAIGALQHGENPAAAYMGQFGGDPDQAPTGKEIAQNLGVVDTALSQKIPGAYNETGEGWRLKKGGWADPTASGAVGLGVDVVADPLNVVGVGELAKGAKMAGGLAAKAVGAGAKGAAVAADVLTGTRAATKSLEAAGAAAKTTGNVAQAAKASIESLLKPSLAKDAADMEGIAAKHGIPAELISPAHEFGDASSITRLQRTIGEGGLGQKYLERHNEGLVKTTQAMEKSLVDNFGHAPASNAEAGQILKDSVDDHVSKVFKEADLTYKTAAKKFPGISLDPGGLEALQSKAIGMKREAQRIARTSADATQLSQAANLEKWADIINGAKGSYKEMSEIVQNVGKAAFGKTPVGQIPADVKKLRELYDAGSETLIQSIRNKSAAAADELVTNNMDIAEMLGDKSALGQALKDSNPERVFNSLVKNGGSEQIATLKKILPPEQFNKLRSKYLSDLVKYSAEKDFGHVINFKGTKAAMEKNAEKLGYMFEPQELKDATELLKFGERYGSPVMSSSGTGGSSAFRNIKDKVVNALVDEQTLDHLKSKARGTAPASAPAASGAAPVTSRGLLRERTPLGQRLKVAQSVSPSQNATRAALKSSGGGVAEEEKNDAPPPKGKDKWANDGLKVLKAHGRDPASSAELDDLKDQLMADPKAKQLLINASDLKPGSKALDTILERIKRDYGSASSKR